MKRLFSRILLQPTAGTVSASGVRPLIIGGVLGIVAYLAFYGYVLVNHYNVLVWLAVTLVVTALALNIAAWFLSRRGRLVEATFAAIIGGFLSFASLPLVFSGISMIFSLAAFLATLTVALQMLPDRYSPWAIAIGLGNIVLASLINLYPPFERVQVAGLTNFIIVISVILILGSLLSLAWIASSLQLTGKLLVAFVVVSMLVTGLFGVINNRQTTTLLQDSIGQGLRNTAANKALSMGDTLHGQIDSLRALAVGEQLQRWVKSSNASYVNDPGVIRNKMSQADQAWRDAVARGDFNNPFILTRLQNDVALDMLEYADILPNNIEIILTDKHGALISASHVTSDYDQSDETWWQATYRDGVGGVYISKPSYDDSVQQNVIIISIPVLDRESQEVMGVLRTTYRMQGLLDILSSNIGSSTIDVDLYFLGDLTQAFHGGKQVIPDPATASFISALPSTTFAEFPYEGVPSLVARAPINTTTSDPDIARLGWYLAIHEDSNIALAPINVQTEGQLAFVGIILGVISFISILVAQAFTRPITRLTMVADRVRGGDLTIQADITTRDEVGRLAATFNEMTAQLRQTLSGLEQRVAARTRELTLAGDVGRSLSEQRDLDSLLKTAVELIASTFDLYYTQIYLSDPGGKALILRAGSGQVGQELLRRGHRLPMALGSLNGAAAVSKQSVLVSDTAEAPDFRPNMLLPETRSEVAVPLMVGNRVVGVLDMQSRRPGAFSPETLPAFQALAAQLGVAVENANLFSQVQQSREEVERQARRQVHLAYDTYLDAIHKRERMGFEFDRQEVRPLESAAQPLQGRVVSMPINVAGETIGKLELARSDAPWPQDDVEWLRTVTQQISRQVDSLRLLSEADRYRQEAEDAARRLTREGWEAYLAEVSENLAYTYDQDQVLPGAFDEELPPLVQPLAMRGEQIGEISLHGVETLDEERAAMLSTVAERLSEHIESLRLSEQTRSALAATDALYAGSEGVVRAGTSDQVLAAIVNATALKQFERGSIMLFSSPWETRMPDLGTFIATWEASGGPPPTPVGTTYPISMVPFLQMLHKDQPVFVADALNDPRLDPQTLKLLENVGRSLAVFPLVVAEQWIGVLTMVASHAVPLTEAQIRQTQSLIGQGAAVVQGLRLLEETTARARREQVLRQVSERVRSATNPEQVLRLAAREVGAALGRSVLVRMKSTETANTAHEQPGGNGHGAKEGA